MWCLHSIRLRRMAFMAFMLFLFELLLSVAGLTAAKREARSAVGPGESLVTFRPPKINGLLTREVPHGDKFLFEEPVMSGPQLRQVPTPPPPNMPYIPPDTMGVRPIDRPTTTPATSSFSPAALLKALLPLLAMSRLAGGGSKMSGETGMLLPLLLSGKGGGLGNGYGHGNPFSGLFGGLYPPSPIAGPPFSWRTPPAASQMRSPTDGKRYISFSDTNRANTNSLNNNLNSP